MKLRNKKTGEIIDYYDGLLGDREVGGYGSLAELNEEWEDYVEPKEYWYIDGYVVIQSGEDNSDIDKNRKEIGNYFDTREEAKKAVEKLKAWKRLKGAGFKFKGYEGVWGGTDDGAYGGEGKIDFAILGKFNPNDLDLLFCPEENS